MKILFLDIETKASVVNTFQIRDVSIGINQIIKRGSMICWSAKWKDEDEVLFDADWISSHRKMVKHIWQLLDECDILCTYNGKSFDTKSINKEFLLAGLPPPSPYKQLDLLQVVRRNFKFISNKLDNVSQELGIGCKVKHSGMDLWNAVEAKDPEAQKLMQEYNEQDTVLLEKLYYKLESWLSGFINFNESSEEVVCPTCNSTHLHKRGFQKTSTQVYQRYRCVSCHSWSRSNKAIKELRKSESVISIK